MGPATGVGAVVIEAAGVGAFSQPIKPMHSPIRMIRFILDVAIIIGEKLPITHRAVFFAHDDKIGVRGHKQ